MLKLTSINFWSSFEILKFRAKICKYQNSYFYYTFDFGKIIEIMIEGIKRNRYMLLVSKFIKWMIEIKFTILFRCLLEIISLYLYSAKF